MSYIAEKEEEVPEMRSSISEKKNGLRPKTHLFPLVYVCQLTGVREGVCQNGKRVTVTAC